MTTDEHGKVITVTIDASDYDELLQDALALIDAHQRIAELEAIDGIRRHLEAEPLDVSTVDEPGLEHVRGMLVKVATGDAYVVVSLAAWDRLMQALEERNTDHLLDYLSTLDSTERLAFIQAAIDKRLTHRTASAKMTPSA